MEIPFSPEQWHIVDEEVKNLLNKGAIVPSCTEQNQFISTIFIVPKPNGKFRPVINLKYLNEFIHYNHFKQETFKVVLDLIQHGDYMTSVDMTDAYFSIPIHESFQKYLKFSWNGNLYKFVALPFGIKSAPYVFTKVLRPVYAMFRQRGFRCSYYIDDSLNLHLSKEICHENTVTMLETLISLGFTINREKSVLVPTQRIKFFGFIIDSVQFKVFLTDDKVKKIQEKAQLLLESKTVVVRTLASFIGLIINAFYAVLEAPLYYRNMERNKLEGLGCNYCFDNQVSISEKCRLEITWWKNNVENKNGKRIRPDSVQKIFHSDASNHGWGSFEVDSEKHAGGRWSFEEAQNNINYLELLSIFYGLQSLYVNCLDIHIQVQSDNTSAIKYINDMGGMTSVIMDNLAKEIWDWCICRNIYISAIHIPGKQNVSADFYSRNFSDSTEWMLKDNIFQRVCSHFFMPDIDLFASRLNKKLTRFISWFPEPGAFHVDAFSLSWSQFKPYIFPPFNLIAKVLNKIVQDNVERAILILPFWRAQAWFPVLLERIISLPVRLPRHRDLLTLPFNGEKHPLSKKMKTFAVCVSGGHSITQELQRQLLTQLSVRGQQVLVNNTDLHGKNGVLGVISGVKIPFVRLKLKY